MRRHAVMLVLFLLLSPSVLADESGWPREVETKEGTITIYQPQVESFSDTVLEARAAIAVRLPEGDGLLFGAVWYKARVSVDREERVVYLEDVRVPLVRFPEAGEEERDRLARFLEKQIPESDLTISLDRLLASLDMSEDDAAAAGLKSDPPVILLSSRPAILITMDGPPILQDMKESKGGELEQVVNTPFLMVKLKSAETFFLSAGGDLWYEASAAEGPWSVAAQVPSAVAALIPEDEPTPEGEAPDVYVATTPTELIVSAGDPTWAPVENLDLLYMDNTDSDVFLDIRGQHYYVLLSGRWYRAPSVGEGLTWENVANDQLPAAFSDIQEDSVNGGVLPHVAGTNQAREAVLDSSIPQTAAIRRDAASLSVDYDGVPEFVVVDDLEEVRYAVNTAIPVFLVGDAYFACDQAVWYRGGSPTGPWKVATEIPAVIYQLPASNPHYNVIFVKVYEVKPEVVYVGYTSGYMHSYHHHGCLVYGTGWWYRPWYRYYYYPRPATYGFRVNYNPWTGWGFGMTWSNGPFTISVGGYGGGRYVGGWFGPVGYRPYYRPPVAVGYRKTNININTGDINIGGGQRPGSGGQRPGTGTRPEQRPSSDIYNRPENRDRNAQRPQVADRQKPGTPTPARNDVYTDRDGNVYRRDENGQWQQRDQGRWKSAEHLDKAGSAADRTRPAPSPGIPGAGSRPSTGAGSRPSTGAAARPGLERSHQSRQRGTQRSNSYQRSRPSGGARGGGGRRR